MKTVILGIVAWTAVNFLIAFQQYREGFQDGLAKAAADQSSIDNEMVGLGYCAWAAKSSFVHRCNEMREASQ